MHLGTPLGGALDYHPYSDNRFVTLILLIDVSGVLMCLEFSGSVRMTRRFTRTPLSVEVLATTATVTSQSLPLLMIVYLDTDRVPQYFRRQYSSDGPSPSMVPFDESTFTHSARSATETGM